MRRSPLGWAVVISALILATGVGVSALFRLEGWAAGGGKVGLVKVEGTIRSSAQVLDALRQLRDDPHVKAIVVRVDSPGGALAPSQEIFREILRIRRSKPVVCSMGTVAASGGYYVACACTKIIASPGTITGSIGVITVVPNLGELLKKLGIKFQTVASGPLKAAGQPTRAMTEQERRMFKSVISDAYEQFLADVARTRGMKKAKLRPIADGRVFTGRQAKALGLVDELGNLNDAIALAARLGGIKGWPKVVAPQEESRPWIQRLVREGSHTLVHTFVQELGIWPQGALQ